MGTEVIRPSNWLRPFSQGGAEKAGHAVVATLHHVLSNAGEIGPWESSHDAQHPSGNREMLSVSIVPSRRRSAEKAL
jgi:hypothetical protein